MNMMASRAPSSRVLAAACAGVLLAIGPLPVPANGQPTASPQATTPAVQPLPAASAAATHELDAFAAAWAPITAYTATVTVFEQQGTEVQHVVFDYSFRKPSSVTVHVLAGPNAGVTLAWDGGTNVVAHRGSGLAALFKRTLSLHDPLATTIRGSSIDQLSFAAILAHARQQAGRLSAVPGDVIGGVAVDALTLIPATPAADVGLTREVIELSTATHLPMRALGYDGATLVRNVEFSNVQLQN